MTNAVHPAIKLFQFPRMFGIPNLSPFCCKLTVAGLTGRPRTGSSAVATLRVDSPKTKHARIMRSTLWARLA